MTSAMFMDTMFLPHTANTPGDGGCFPHSNPWNNNNNNNNNNTPTTIATDDPWSTTPKNTTPTTSGAAIIVDSPLLLSSVWSPLKKTDDHPHHHHHHFNGSSDNEKKKDVDGWYKSPSSNNNYYKDIATAKAPQIPTLLSLRPPETISFRLDEDDDVSVLNDNPDEDDAAILPQTTYDVLANIFDELYKDESEIDEEEDDEDDFPDGACAA